MALVFYHISLACSDERRIYNAETASVQRVSNVPLRLFYSGMELERERKLPLIERSIGGFVSRVSISICLI